MQQNLVTGCCPDTVCVSKKIRASAIFDIQVHRVKEKIMSPTNCSCKISMYFTVVANNVAPSTICRFQDLCRNVTK